MDIIKKDPNTIAWRDRLIPTTTARTGRWRIFQYPRRATEWKTVEMDLPGFGAVRVHGKVAQMNALLMEAVQFHAIASHVLPNKVTCLLVDMHDLRVTLGGGCRYDHEGVKKLATELRQVTVSGVDKLLVDGIFDRLVPTTTTLIHPITGKPRPLWRAELTPTWSAWMRDDPIPLHYDPTPLGAIRHGISAAVARQVLTHRDTPKGGWKLDGLIREVGAEVTRRNRQLVRQDQETLEGAGVLVVGDRVFQNEKVGGRTLLGHDRTLLGHDRTLLGHDRTLLGQGK